MNIVEARTQKEVDDAAALMRGLYEANKSLYSDDLQTIEAYYRGSWFFKASPKIPTEYCPPQGDVLIAYLDGKAAGTVAIYRMDDKHCELKSMFVEPQFRSSGIASALCRRVIDLAELHGYSSVRLTTGERQLPARSLYDRLGFKIVTPWDDNPPDGYDYYELGVVH